MFTQTNKMLSLPQLLKQIKYDCGAADELKIKLSQLCKNVLIMKENETCFFY